MANTRAILLMTLAMAFFAVTDTCIKLAATTLGTGQILLMSGIGSVLLFLPLLRRECLLISGRHVLEPSVLLRTAGEVTGSLGLVVGLSLLPLSTVTAIMQAQPLSVTMAAAVFLGERVGWRRWLAVMVGFAGVLVILRPGAEGFGPGALWLVLAIVGLTARDLGTRLLPAEITTAFVSALAMLALAMLGAALIPFEGGWRTVAPQAWIWIAGISGSVTLAFLAITAALRTGEISAIAPFRYTRIVFALAIAFAIFGERPDAATWAGMGLIVGSGLFAYWRERRVHSARPDANE